MPKLTILRGIPLSGKTTYTQSHPAISISRDHIRMTLFSLKKYNDYNFSKENEKKVTEEFNNQFERALTLQMPIVLDNTNLKPSYYQGYIDKAIERGYEIEIKDFPISFPKACYRNIVRRIKTGKWIPWKVLWNMHIQFKKLKNNG